MQHQNKRTSRREQSQVVIPTSIRPTLPYFPHTMQYPQAVPWWMGPTAATGFAQIAGMQPYSTNVLPIVPFPNPYQSINMTMGGIQGYPFHPMYQTMPHLTPYTIQPFLEYSLTQEPNLTSNGGKALPSTIEPAKMPSVMEIAEEEEEEEVEEEGMQRSIEQSSNIRMSQEVAECILDELMFKTMVDEIRGKGSSNDEEKEEEEEEEDDEEEEEDEDEEKEEVKDDIKDKESVTLLVEDAMKILKDGKIDR